MYVYIYIYIYIYINDKKIRQTLLVSTHTYIKLFQNPPKTKYPYDQKSH